MSLNKILPPCKLSLFLPFKVQKKFFITQLINYRFFNSNFLNYSKQLQSTNLKKIFSELEGNERARVSEWIKQLDAANERVINFSSNNFILRL